MDRSQASVSQSSPKSVLDVEASEIQSFEDSKAHVELAEPFIPLAEDGAFASERSPVVQKMLISRNVTLKEQMTRLHLNPRKFTAYSEDLIESHDFPGKLEDAKKHQKKLTFISDKNKDAVDAVTIQCSLDGFDISDKTLPRLIECINAEVSGLADLSQDLYPSILSQQRVSEQIAKYNKKMREKLL